MEDSMYRTLFPGDFLADLDRLQRQMQRLTGATTSIRGFGRGSYPALNVAGTPASIEVYAFAPGLEPASIDVIIERGVLTLSGERRSDLPGDQAQGTVHMNERFAGRYQRAVSLPEDADPDQVAARYADGVLHISVKRRTAAQRRKIDIQ
jgi:HSP20 family protein